MIGSGGGGGDVTLSTAEPVAVDLAEFSITPGGFEVPAGGSVQVTNLGSAMHNLEVRDVGIVTPDITTGSAATLDVSGLPPGEYEVFCNIAGHEAAGMVTTMEVVEGRGLVAAAPADAGEDAEGHSTSHDGTDYAQMDRDMIESIMAFPAETEGVGNQVLEPTVAPDGTKVFELTAEVIEWEVEPGKVVEAWAYNGQVPAPTIRVDVGDRVRVELQNDLPMGTDIHWHGIRTPNDQDGVAPITQDLVEPGEAYTYTFTATETAVGMYHPHNHAQLQVINGMLGAFIVGELPMPTGRTVGGRAIPADVEVSQEIPMVLNDAGVIGFSLNGKSFPATEPIVAEEGDWLLIHYMNEGLQIHPMHLHQMEQLVVAKDGEALDSPYWADTVNVAPGERYSVLVEAHSAGTWVWHCHILNHVEREDGMFGMVTAMVVQ